MSSTPRNHNPAWDYYQDSAAVMGMNEFGYAPAQLLTSSHQHHHAHTLQYSAPAPSAHNVLLEAPTSDLPSLSPLKQASPQASPPISADTQVFDSIKMPPPNMTNIHKESPSKKVGSDLSPYHQHHNLAQKPPQKAIFTTFSATRAGEKDHLYAQQHLCSDGLIAHSDPVYGGSYGTILGKRCMSDTITESNPIPRANKKLKIEEGPVDLPDPSLLPALKDEGVKPSYSYAQLIGMAILRAENRRLTLSQIYKWISDSFVYYRQAEQGWMNSIRHNLSLNKAFEKQERPKDDPGKGNYWVIVKGQEGQFLNAKPFRRSAQAEFHVQPAVNSKITEEQQQPYPTGDGSFVEPASPSRIVDSSRFPGDDALSSDATLPVSDPVVGQYDQEETKLPLPPAKALHLSSPSPPANINSSPPISHQAHITSGPGLQAPPLQRMSHSRTSSRPTSSRPSSRPSSSQEKPHNEIFRDSGFYSSIESSAVRGHKRRASNFDEETVRPLKRGRAEEEIARIRGSSFGPSPRKRVNRKVSQRASTSAHVQPSSPLRQSESVATPAGEAPLTPPFQLPLEAHWYNSPPVSPNTHLRRHREKYRSLVDTPAQVLAPPQDQNLTSWSPSFSIHHENNGVGYQTPGTNKVENAFSNAYVTDIFEDSLNSLFEGGYEAYFARGSPVKSDMKRPALQRAATSTGVLNDVTHVRRNNRLASPINLAPPVTPQNSQPPMKKTHQEAPKTPVGKSSNKISDEFWGLDSVNQTSYDEYNQWLQLSGSNGSTETAIGIEETGEKVIDIAQGFPTIGSNTSALRRAQEEKENLISAALDSTKKITKQANAVAPLVKTQRPVLARSMTNTF